MSEKTYDNNMTGALFRNEKRTNDKQPEYNGSITINGVEYWQSAWVKESKAGKKFFSQSFTPKNPPQEAAYAAPQPLSVVDADDIPF